MIGRGAGLMKLAVCLSDEYGGKADCGMKSGLLGSGIGDLGIGALLR